MELFWNQVLKRKNPRHKKFTIIGKDGDKHVFIDKHGGILDKIREALRVRKILPAVLILAASVARGATTFTGAIVQPVSVVGPVSITGSTVSVSGSTVSVSGSTVQVTGISGGPVAVSATSLPLPAGAATSANQTTEIGYLSTISTVISSTVSVFGSTVVVTGLNGGAVPVTINQSSTMVTKSSVAVTTVSTLLFSAQPTRLGIECTALCTNTDYVYLNINSASAAVPTDYPLSPCSSWSPPYGVVVTGAAQAIANTGTQVVRCVSYTP